MLLPIGFRPRYELSVHLRKMHIPQQAYQQTKTNSDEVVARVALDCQLSISHVLPVRDCAAYIFNLAELDCLCTAAKPNLGRVGNASPLGYRQSDFQSS
jgi:hypothetical protein